MTRTNFKRIILIGGGASDIVWDWLDRIYVREFEYEKVKKG